MPALTPRDAVRQWVKEYVEEHKEAAPMVWTKLYAAFEVEMNWALRREAYNAGESPLNWVEMKGRMVELMPFAKIFLGIGGP